MTHRLLFVLVGSLSCSAVASAQSTAQPAVHASVQSAPPTFAKDVAPILFAKCANCHRPGEVAPMSLLSYTDARPWAKAIKNKVVNREMPPWGRQPRAVAAHAQRRQPER